MPPSSSGASSSEDNTLAFYECIVCIGDVRTRAVDGLTPWSHTMTRYLANKLVSMHADPFSYTHLSTCSHRSEKKTPHVRCRLSRLVGVVPFLCVALSILKEEL